MIKFVRVLSLSLSTAALISACKILPTKVRSGTSAKKVDGLLDADTIRFVRNSDQKSGNLSFQLKDEHNCRIDYWAKDPSGTPPPASPLSIDCDKDQLALAHSVDISGITPGYPLNFRIYVWPKTTTFLASFVKDYSEGQDLDGKSAQDLIIVRYMAPRQSAEIYSFRSAGAMSLSSIKAKLSGATETSCVERPQAETLPFPRSSSVEDTEKRPLLGLSKLTTEGFGSGEATVHPFFNTRLVENFEQVARQENWTFNFQWENKPYSFESLPPGYLGSLAVGDGSTSRSVSGRSLAGSLETIDISANRLKLVPRIIFPSDVSRFQLTVKSGDAAETLLSCQFKIDSETIEVPEEFVSRLAQGNYLLTFTYETNQIHYNEQGTYPPWIITSQDVVQFRLNKRL